LKKLIQNKKKLFLFALFLGSITSLSLPPYNYFLINFITFNIFFILFFKNNTLKKKVDFFLYGWFFGFGYFFFSLYWISISLTFDLNFKVLIPIALLLIPGVLSIFFGLAALLFSYFLHLNIFSSILTFSVILAFFEFIRGSIFTGFPWNLFVFSFSNNLSFLQALSYFGTYGLNLFCITFFLIPSIYILKKTNFDKYLSYIVFLIFISFFIFGNLRLNNNNFLNVKNENIQIKIISSNIDVNRFYNIKNEEEILFQLIDLSKSDKLNSTIFIWPEGVITSSFIRDIKKYKSIFEENFHKDEFIILGINDLKNNYKTEIYNSLAVFDNKLNLISVYHKNKLVPFGEFLPLENQLSKLGLKKITNSFQSFSKGTSRDIIKIKNLSILPLICYEVIYSGKLSNTNNYDFIINISEDGWFGKSIGISQHFYHSIFRSIEEGKSVIRSSNNGISAVVNPKGKILKIKKSTESGVITINELEILSKKTLFSIYGNNIFFYLSLIYITLIFFLKSKGR
tara:strand:+ start:729 stop:2264 length:1536 start_codon:yes stop_codon:yes gene_type:complete